MSAIGLSLIFPIILVALVIVLVRAFSNKGHERSEGGDLVAYALLALFVGGLVWALLLLGRAAFPGTDIVGTSRGDLAGALAGLIVAGPLTYYLWQRQDDRRNRFPASVGWSLYLALTDAIYLTWLVVYGVLIVTALIGDNDYPRWTDVLIVGSVVALHEWAAIQDRPGGVISQIRRVVGSLIGLVTLTTGVGLLLYSLFDTIYRSFEAGAGNPPIEAAIAMTIVGGAVWAWRWLLPWTQRPDGSRLTYLVLVSYSAFIAIVGSVTTIAIIVITYLLERPDSAFQHFEPVTVALAIAVTAVLAWMHHRPLLGPERSDSVRSYDYLLMATGLGAAIAAGTSLVSLVFSPNLLVDEIGTAAVALVIAFAAAGTVWWLFWTNAQSAPREAEASSFPRRLYLIGLSIVFGLTAAGAVVGVLLYIFQLLFDLNPRSSTLTTELALAVLAGAAAFHLYSTYKGDSALRAEGVGEPFLVTVICSHPGPLAATLPAEANLKVIHRGDSIGVIDEEMAQQIAEAVTGVNSIVWVGETGFEVARALDS